MLFLRRSSRRTPIVAALVAFSARSDRALIHLIDSRVLQLFIPSSALFVVKTVRRRATGGMPLRYRRISRLPRNGAADPAAVGKDCHAAVQTPDGALWCLLLKWQRMGTTCHAPDFRLRML